MRNNLKHLFLLICIITVLMLPYFAFAVDPTAAMRNVAGNGGFEVGDDQSDRVLFSRILGNIISTFFGLLGAIFIILMVYAGYNWMTARGDESKVEKAISTIQKAVIGLIITVGSYAIWNFIFHALLF